MIPASALTGYGNAVRHNFLKIAVRKRPGRTRPSAFTLYYLEEARRRLLMEFDPVHLLIEDSVGDIPPEINDFFDKLLDPFASGHTHGAEERGEPELQPCVC